MSTLSSTENLSNVGLKTQLSYVCASNWLFNLKFVLLSIELVLFTE